MKHNTVKSLSSWDRLVWETDVELQHRIPGGTTEALVTDLEDGSRTVVFVRDRLLPKNLEVIATHEFGHVIGLPDLPTMGDVMSAVHTRGEVVSTINLTPADIELCRGFGYCD